MVVDCRLFTYYEEIGKYGMALCLVNVFGDAFFCI